VVHAVEEANETWLVAHEVQALDLGADEYVSTGQMEQLEVPGVSVAQNVPALQLVHANLEEL
jgi:hypothetical protein